MKISQLKVVFLFSIPLKSVGQKSVDLACKEKLERNQDFQFLSILKTKQTKTNSLVTLLQPESSKKELQRLIL